MAYVTVKRLEVIQITAMPEYSGKSFEELRIEDYQQGRDWGNRLRRLCHLSALARDKQSNTQLKKQVGVSRCTPFEELWSDADMEKIRESVD